MYVCRQSEDRLEAKIASMMRKQAINEEASALQSQNVREKVQSISLWQEVTQQTLRELQHQAQITPNELRDLQEKHSAFRSEVDTRVKSEADERLKDVEKLKVEIERIRGQSGDKKADTSEIEACQTSVRKLAESITTIKMVLGMKIQSEQIMRKTEMAALEEQVRKLNEIVERLKQEDLKNKEKKAEDKNDDKDSEKEDDKDKDEDKESEKNKDGDKKSEADDREDDKKSEKNKDGDKKRKKEDKKDKDDDKDERTAEDLRKL
ncbi:hypothetical protein CAPTEDRAFT_225276 [Capitella teleta]|uniref:Uncharacterized protein n=1 Tax=Capitella teleta TaxID=283909 RepID=R7U5N5_CAPTE|nr:hypothetical protein CAPTEDRAFT_225276 [Capitella teleta]|eukprot:ELT98455.1 hypothetical protein CAPTEDRAFT_225276 [Capitella teleta]